MKAPNRHKEIKTFILDYVSKNDIFWIHEIKEVLEITDSDSLESNCVSKICIELMKEGILIVSDKKGNHTQYMRV